MTRHSALRRCFGLAPFCLCMVLLSGCDSDDQTAANAHTSVADAQPAAVEETLADDSLEGRAPNLAIAEDAAASAVTAADDPAHHPYDANPEQAVQ